MGLTNLLDKLGKNLEDFSFLFNVRIDSVEKLDGQVGGTIG